VKPLRESRDDTEHLTCRRAFRSHLTCLAEMARLSPANVTRVAVQRFGRAPLSSASPATVSCVLKTRGLSSSTTIARQAQASKPQSAVAAKELGPFGLKNDYARIQKSRNAKKPWKTELNPSWLLERASRIYPNNTAVLHEGRSYNYRESGLGRTGNVEETRGIDKSSTHSVDQ
jgi:hypothetical protein